MLERTPINAPAEPYRGPLRQARRVRAHVLSVLAQRSAGALAHSLAHLLAALHMPPRDPRGMRPLAGRSK